MLHYIELYFGIGVVFALFVALLSGITDEDFDLWSLLLVSITWPIAIAKLAGAALRAFLA